MHAHGSPANQSAMAPSMAHGRNRALPSTDQTNDNKQRPAAGPSRGSCARSLRHSWRCLHDARRRAVSWLDGFGKQARLDRGQIRPDILGAAAATARAAMIDPAAQIIAVAVAPPSPK